MTHNIHSTITFPSRLMPGVVFTLRRPTEIRRAAVLLASSEACQLARALGAEGDAALKRQDYDQVTAMLTKANALLNANVKPSLIRYAWVGVTGLTIDGQPPDVEAFIYNSPSALVSELHAFVTALYEGNDADVSVPLPTVADHRLVN